jgi:Fe-S oxidoreductase
MGSGNTSASPFGKVNAIHWSSQTSKWPRKEAAELSYLCTDCNLCTHVCEHEQPVADYLFNFREELFSAQTPPDCSKSIAPNETELGKTLHRLSRKFKGKRSSSVLFFPGCDLLAQGAERVEQILGLLEALGIQDVGIAPSTPICCGIPYRDMGDTANFMSRAIKWQRHFSKANGVIMGDSRCLKSQPELLDTTLGRGHAPRIFSLWEVLLRSVRGPLKRKLDLKVAVLKSCHLNLTLQKAKMPRALFDSLFKEPPILLSEEGNMELCCGFGGGMAQAHPETAQGAARTLLNQAKVLECDAILSLSPSCAAHLKSAQIEGEHPEAIDLVDVLLRALKMEER